MKKTLIAFTLILSLAACNTFEGIGKDMRGAGEGIANGANKVKEKL